MSKQDPFPEVPKEILQVVVIMRGQRILVRDAVELIRRNGRFGTCADCPRDASGKVYPEKCKNTERQDHWLGWIT
jgi:hypothetical protein